MSTNWENPYIAKLQQLPSIIIAGDSNSLSPENINTIRSYTESYENIFLEFGSGSGRHLIEHAKRNCTAAYVGFELRYKRAFRTAEKAQKQSLINLFVMRTSAFLAPEIFPPASIAGIYVNFPDPWDKKKWHKHRLLNSSFLLKIHALLKIGGFLSYKSDHEEYFHATRALIEHSGLFTITECTTDLHNSEFAATNILTEFENLFISKGLPTFQLKASRV